MVGYELKLLSQSLILSINISYRQLLLLIRIDTYAIYHITWYNQVFYSTSHVTLPGITNRTIQPTKERLPFTFHKHLATNVNIRKKSSKNRYLGFCFLMLYTNLGENYAVYNN